MKKSFVIACAAALIAVLAAVSFGGAAFAETKEKAKTKDAKGADKGGQEQQVQQAVAIPSPWTKICNKDPQAGNKEICLTAQDIRAETGQFLASVAVREVEGDPKKQFIVAVPPGMQLQPGMRIVIDQNQPMPARYTICFPNACYGDMDIDKGFVDIM
jgi:invasion protein IalB